MFTENRVTVAARCSLCGSIIDTELSVFNLSASGIHVQCPNCKKSSLDIALSQDGKVRLSVPCLACPKPHPFTLSPKSVFTKELFVLQCSFTRIDICFMGNAKRVREALLENGRELRMMATEPFDDERSDESVAIYQNLLIILSFVKECENSGRLLCHCKEMKPVSGVDIKVNEDNVEVTCKDCGRKTVISALDADEIEALMDDGKIVLGDE